MDIYFILDVIFNFFIYDKINFEHKTIIRKYMKFLFWVELMLAIPFWLFGAP